jgi:hypothetical protein
VFENRILRRIFGPKRDTSKVRGECRKMHNEELHYLYSSPNYPNIIRQMKSRRTSWAGHVARTGEERKVYEWESQKKRDHSED